MKQFLVLLIVAATLLPARAQDDEKFEWGIKIGMVLASQEYEGKSNPDLKQLIGPSAGFLFEIPICKYFEIRPELNFNTHGQRWVVESGDDKIVATQAWGYLEFPILAKVKYGNEKIGGFVNVGPQFGAGLFGETRTRSKINGERDSDRETIHFDDAIFDFKRFDAGMAFGLGMECNKTGIEVEARYYIGMADIQNESIFHPSSEKKTTNRSLNFMVGWKF